MKQFLFFQFFLLFCTSLFSQTRELDISDANNDKAAVIQIQGNDPSASDFTQMILGFNPSNEGWLRTTTNHDLSFWTDDTRRFTIKKDGRVGIGTSNPSADFEVHGSTVLDSPNGTITITTAAATIEVLPNGNINILSSGNIDVDAGGNLSLSAEGNIDIETEGSLNIDAGNIDVNTNLLTVLSQTDIDLVSNKGFTLLTQNSEISSNNNTTINTGNDMINNINGNYELEIGEHHTLTINENYSSIIGGNYALTASNTTQAFATNFQLTAGSLTSLQSSLITLNGNNTGAPAARLGDTIAGSKIATGSNSVFIGN